MKNLKFLPTLFLFVILGGCTATVASVLSAIANWAPVGETAFNGIVAVVNPGESAVYSKDSEAVISALTDLSSAVQSAQASGSTSKVVADLQAVSSGVQKVTADIDPLLSNNDQAFANAAAAIVEVTASAFEAKLSGAAPVSSAPVSTAELVYTPYGDGSFYVAASYDPVEAISYASPGQAAQAHPAAAKSKPPKLGDFKRQYNAAAKKYGHPDKQLKLSLMEKLHLK